MKPAQYFKNVAYNKNKTNFYNSFQQIANKTINPKKSKTTQFRTHKYQATKLSNKTGEHKKLYDSFMQKIMNQLFESESSSIGKEIPLDINKRQEIVQDFVQRQEFQARESKILKQMEEFCQYGVIREGFH